MKDQSIQMQEQYGNLFKFLLSNCKNIFFKIAQKFSEKCGISGNLLKIYICY